MEPKIMKFEFELSEKASNIFVWLWTPFPFGAWKGNTSVKRVE
jgi:hypothetical protein